MLSVMKTTIATLGMAMTLAVTGCSAAGSDGTLSTSEDPLTNESETWKALPRMPSGRPVRVLSPGHALRSCGDG